MPSIPGLYVWSSAGPEPPLSTEGVPQLVGVSWDHPTSEVVGRYEFSVSAQLLYSSKRSAKVLKVASSSPGRNFWTLSMGFGVGLRCEKTDCAT